MSKESAMSDCEQSGSSTYESEEKCSVRSGDEDQISDGDDMDVSISKAEEDADSSYASTPPLICVR